MATPVADPAGIAAVQDILREVWVSDALESQLLAETILLDYIEDISEFTDSDGLKASVPLRTGRTGGISSRGIGEKLGPAGRQRVAKASYNYTNHYLTVKVLGPVVARMKTNRQSAVREIDLEVKNGIEDFQMDWQRQLHTGGDAVIATITAFAGSTVTVNNALGKHACAVGWIYEGMWLDCGTAANPILGFQGLKVLDVDDETGVITFDQAVGGTVAVGQQLSRYGNRIATGQTSHEMNGLNRLLNKTAPVGGIDPTTAGNKYWRPVVLDNGGTLRAMSIDLLLRVDQKLRQKGGKAELLIGDLDQERRYYNLLESKVRFIGDKKMTEGNLKGLEFNGKMFVGDPHCPPNKVDFIAKGSLAMYSAGAVAWQNQTTGGDILSWVQDEDAFVARAAKYCNLGTDRRNTLGRLGDLDAA